MLETQHFKTTQRNIKAEAHYDKNHAQCKQRTLPSAQFN